MYAIIIAIKEVIAIKTHFNWLFYKNDKLIEEYKNLKIFNDIYEVSNNLKLLKENNNYILKRTGADYEVTINFNNKLCCINFFKENIITELELLQLEIVDKKDKLTIIYMLDIDETNKLVLELKE